MIFPLFLGKDGKKRILKILFILAEAVFYIIIEERKGEIFRRIHGAVLSENLVFRRTPEKD